MHDHMTGCQSLLKSEKIVLHFARYAFLSAPKQCMCLEGFCAASGGNMGSGHSWQIFALLRGK